MNAINTKLKNFQSIQVLRGIASLLVVLFHATENSRLNLKTEFLGGYFSFGGSGVDIFFVLSGFIITYTSSRDIHNPNALFSFLKRRFVRIYPTYWLIISGFLVVQFFLPAVYRSSYSSDAGNLIPTYLLLPGHTMVNGVSWTLTNELFFYLLFSLAFLFPNKKLFFRIMSVYALILAGIYITGNNFTLGNRWADLLIFPMNIEFFMGVVAAIFFSKVPPRFCWVLMVLGVVLFLAGGMSEVNRHMLFANGFNRVIYYGIPAFLVIIGIVRLELTRDLRPHGILTSLGDASYSLYLLHLPILAASTKLLARFNGSNFFYHVIIVLLVIVVCIMSVLFFKFIENPLIRKLNKKKPNLKYI